MIGRASARLLAVVAGLVLSSAADARETKRHRPPPPTPLEAIAEAFGAGEYERTLSLVAALGAGGESNPEALFYRAYALLRLERHEEALSVIERTLTLAPADVRAVYLRGVLRVTLGRPGAVADFTRVKQEVPDAPIGISSGEYLEELAGEEAAHVAAAPAARPAEAEHPAGGAEPADALGAGAMPTSGEDWRLAPDLRLTLDYDSNPALLPARSQAAADPGPTGSPALTASGRLEASRLVGPESKLGLWASALQLLYYSSPGNDSVRSDSYPGGVTPGTGGSIAGSSNLTDLALGASLERRDGELSTRVDLRGELLLYGFSLFAQQYTLGLRATWPARAAVSGTVRASVWALLPFDSNYTQLRGVGGILRPLASLLLLDGAVLLEGGWALELYRAHDYYKPLPGSQPPEPPDVFLSYSYWAQGPELYASALGPAGLRLSAWASMSSRRYLDASYLSTVLYVVRQDTRSSVGAHAGLDVARDRELFLEASWVRNASNFDRGGFFNQAYHRFLVSVGVEWR
jgi:hypothetical protein